jgi:adenosylcobinamide-GDP ribazoletransferase
MNDLSSVPGADRGHAALLGLRAALTFLTTVPISPPTSAQMERDPGLYGRAFGWYPLVGLLIGLLLMAVYWILSLVALPPMVAAGILLLVWVLVTGGLHLDGLMDSCDALFAPVDVARRLVILKDVHTGAFGVIGVVWLLGMKWSLLTQFFTQPATADSNLAYAALLLAPAWGRWMLVWAAQRFPYARRESSLGEFMRRGLSVRQTVAASATVLVAQAGVTLFEPDLLWILPAPIVGILLARWAANRLGGGLTGDLYGALCEVVEVVAMVGIVMRGA